MENFLFPVLVSVGSLALLLFSKFYNIKISHIYSSLKSFKQEIRDLKEKVSEIPAKYSTKDELTQSKLELNKRLDRIDLKLDKLLEREK